MLCYLVVASLRRRESGILSLPRWMTDEVEVPEGAGGGSAGDAAELLEIFEKLLFQNSEPITRET